MPAIAPYATQRRIGVRRISHTDGPSPTVMTTAPTIAIQPAVSRTSDVAIANMATITTAAMNADTVRPVSHGVGSPGGPGGPSTERTNRWAAFAACGGGSTTVSAPVTGSTNRTEVPITEASLPAS